MCAPFEGLIVWCRGVDRRFPIFGIPDDLVLLVEVGGVVGDVDDGFGGGDFLLRDSHRVTWNPEQGDFLADRGVEVSVGFILLGILDRNVSGHKLAHGGVIAVDVRSQPLLEEVGPLFCSARRLGVDVTVFNRMSLLVDPVLLAMLATCLGCKQSALLCVERFGEEVDQWLQGGVKADLVQGGEDEHENHQDEGTDSTNAAGDRDGKESDQADLGDVQADENLLQCTWVDPAFGVDVRLGNEKDCIQG
nr:hypothetical protein CFP56_12074 [Quercus suber]